MPGNRFGNISWSDAVFLVAASDASREVKERADLVCPGTNDEKIIQKAIDALPSTGGRVLLSEGNFYVASPIDLGKETKNLTLEGSGLWVTTIHQRANMTALIYGSVGNSRAKVRHMTVQGDRTTYSTGHGVDASNLSLIRLDHVLARSMPEDGFRNVSFCWACEASDNGGWGFHSSAFGCDIYGCNTAANVTGGYLVDASAASVVNLVGCKASNDPIGIQIDGNAGSVCISGVQIAGCSGTGLWLRYVSQKVVVSGVDIGVPNGATGVKIGDSTAGYNSVGVTIAGLNIRGDSTAGTTGIDCDVANYFNLAGFHIENCNVGLRLNDGSNNKLSVGSVSSCTTALSLVAGTTGVHGTANWLLHDVAGLTYANSGSGSIADTLSSATVSHGLDGTPNVVVVTPAAQETLWVSNITSTDFTVNRTGTTGALTFYWYATL